MTEEEENDVLNLDENLDGDAFLPANLSDTDL